MEKQVIYFFGSIKGEKSDTNLRNSLISHLKMYGEVIDEHFYSQRPPSIWDRDMKNIAKATVLVGEVTAASTGAGIEIGTVLERNRWVEDRMKKRILCLYRTPEERTSGLITDCTLPNFSRGRYSALEEAFGIIDEFFQNP